MKEMKEFIPLSSDLPFQRIFGCEDNIKFTIKMLDSLFNLPKGSLNGSIITNSVLLTEKQLMIESLN